MAHTVGPKGQVVIAKALRDRLGVKPGWLALQRIVGDHVELYFLAPEHRLSLKGSLVNYLKVHVEPEEWHDARAAAWTQQAEERARSDDSPR